MLPGIQTNESLVCHISVITTFFTKNITDSLRADHISVAMGLAAFPYSLNSSNFGTSFQGLIYLFMSLFQRYPNVSRLLLFVLLIVIALILPDFLGFTGEIQYVFPFTGLILVVIANWILYRTENTTLAAIGFSFSARNLSYLPVGLLLGISAVLLGYYLKCLLTGDHIIINHGFSPTEILKHLYWILPTAAVQEFICRSYGYHKLISTFNLRVANLVVVVVFIAMHNVFNIGIFSAIFYSISLIIGHFAFANALLSSGTIYFAIGLHWGSNVANNQLFTDEKLSTSLLFLEKVVATEPSGPNPIGILLYLLALNIGFILLWVFLRRKRMKNGIQIQTIPTE